MYNELDNGKGVTKRRLDRLCLQVSGDGQHAPLFRAIRDLFIQALLALMEEAKKKIEEVLNRCSVEINADLELVRGENSSASDGNHLLERMSQALEDAQRRRAEALDVFEAHVSR